MGSQPHWQAYEAAFGKDNIWAPDNQLEEALYNTRNHQKAIADILQHE